MTRFPRTRGDGPAGQRQRDADLMPVFPPHARGWTASAVKTLRPDLVSPHARGWTFLRSHPHGEELVSPARAGMDP